MWGWHSRKPEGSGLTSTALEKTGRFHRSRAEPKDAIRTVNSGAWVRFVFGEMAFIQVWCNVYWSDLPALNIQKTPAGQTEWRELPNGGKWKLEGFFFKLNTWGFFLLINPDTSFFYFFFILRAIQPNYSASAFRRWQQLKCREDEWKAPGMCGLY